MSKYLYLIASHKEPTQVIRLVKAIKKGSPNSIIIIHHDSSHSELDDCELKEMPDVMQLDNTTQVEWGGISMVQMVLNCISYIVEHAIEFDWFIFLSGQDYPIRPISEIERSLENTKYDGFMTYFSLNSKDPLTRKLVFDRYYFRYFKLLNHWRISKFLEQIKTINQFQSFFRIFPGSRNANPRLGIRRVHTIFDNKFVCYKGQFWMTINKKSLLYVDNFVRKTPKYYRYYSKSFIPDESFFQTLLVNNNELKIKNDHKRYMDWTGGNLSHPKTLGVSNYERMIKTDNYFARKFDSAYDFHVLDMLDEYINSGQNR